MSRAGFLVALIVLFGAAACAPIPTLAPFPTPPTPTPISFVPATPSATPEPDDTGWVALASGIEWRRMWVSAGAQRERLRLVRLDPNTILVRIAYEPQHPRRISEWAQALPSAVLVVNAGYFTQDMQATGLIVKDGVPSGRSYGEFAGMLAVDSEGRVTLRWLRNWPYYPDEGLIQAVQSFPVLVKPGGVMGFPPDADEGQRARRTVVAQDFAGHLLFIVSPSSFFSLHELAVWLVESDLQVDIALNLDGGTSTGLWVSGHEDPIDSLMPVPAVIAVEPRID